MCSFHKGGRHSSVLGCPQPSLQTPGGCRFRKCLSFVFCVILTPFIVFVQFYRAHSLYYFIFAKLFSWFRLWLARSNNGKILPLLKKRVSVQRFGTIVRDR